MHSTDSSPVSGWFESGCCFSRTTLHSVMIAEGGDAFDDDPREQVMSMKSILVPMEPHDGMASVLETALLLARKCDSYIEGFPLRFGISEFVAVDPAGSIPLESYRQESIEEAAQARRMFETFMQERGVPKASGTAGG